MQELCSTVIHLEAIHHALLFSQAPKTTVQDLNVNKRVETIHLTYTFLSLLAPGETISTVLGFLCLVPVSQLIFAFELTDLKSRFNSQLNWTLLP